MVEIYKHRGFKGVVIYADPEFEAIKKNNGMLQAFINTTAAKEHVPEVECQIQVIKEQVHAAHNTLPYSIIPKIMVAWMVRYVVAWLQLSTMWRCQ